MKKNVWILDINNWPKSETVKLSIKVNESLKDFWWSELETISKDTASSVNNAITENNIESLENPVVLNLEELWDKLWLTETPEIKELWKNVAKLMINNLDYSELNKKYWDEIRILESSFENKSEKTQIAVWLMTAKVRINWWKIENAIEDLDAMLEYVDMMANMDPEYWEIWDKIYEIKKSLKI